MWKADFEFKYNDVKVYFGPGVLKKNFTSAVQGTRKALVLTSRSAARVSGALDDVFSSLKESQVDYVVFDKVTPNPYTSVVDSAVEVAENEGVDTVIAIGGGSVIDVSKVVSVLVGSGIKARDLFLGATVTARPLKLLVVNLTHGTGSEVDRFAVLTLEGTIEKRGLMVRYPDVSFDDPVYTVSLSRDQTLYTSLDAFYHAYESATAKRANLMVQTLAEAVVEIVAKYLGRTLSNPRDLEARTMLLYASMLAGICIDMTRGTHIVHALEHGFSGLKPELPHGAGLAILGPRSVYYVHKAVPEVSAKLLKHLDPGISPSPDDAERAAKAVENFQRTHGFEKKLSDYGVSERDFKPVLDFVERTIVERFSVNTPFQVTRQLLEDIAKRAL